MTETPSTKPKGTAADSATMNPVFHVPLIGYLLLVGSALASSHARVRNAAAAGGPGGH